MADWQKGDLALCVKGGPWDAVQALRGGVWPECGQIVTVERVAFERSDVTPGGTLFLYSKELPINTDGSRSWGAVRFIKVTPDAEDAFDREVIAHMAGQEVENA